MVARRRSSSAQITDIISKYCGEPDLLAACATVHVKVDPITIYAKLDANVRLQLDEDVKALIQKNPNLF